MSIGTVDRANVARSFRATNRSPIPVSVIEEVADAYSENGLAEAIGAFESARLGDRRLRLTMECVERVISLRRLAGELLHFGEMIERLGLGPGSRHVLDRWGISPRIEMHGAAWQVLAREPFLAFGNHPAGLEGVLFSSLLDREDVYFLAGSHVKQVSSAIGEKVIEVTDTGSKRDYGRSGPAGRLLRGVRQTVWRVNGAGASDNTRAIERAAWLVGENGAGLHVFPAGTMEPGAPWRRGIGRIAAELIRRPGTDPSSVFVVPVVYGVGLVHPLASGLFAPRSALRMLAHVRMWTWTGPAWVFIPAPVRLSELGLDGTEPPEAITDELHDLWLLASTEARTAIGRWSPFQGFRAWRAGCL